jgi:hypothetical protein
VVGIHTIQSPDIEHPTVGVVIEGGTVILGCQNTKLPGQYMAGLS